MAYISNIYLKFKNSRIILMNFKHKCALALNLQFKILSSERNKVIITYKSLKKEGKNL